MSWRASRTRPAALLVPAQRRDQQSGDKQSCKPDSTCSSACPRSAGHDAVLGAGRSQPACRLHSGVHLRRESVTSTLFAGSRWQRRRKRCAWLFPGVGQAICSQSTPSVNIAVPSATNLVQIDANSITVCGITATGHIACGVPGFLDCPQDINPEEDSTILYWHIAVAEDHVCALPLA